jgi:hypothetical protein
MNGEIVHIVGIESGVIHLADGRFIDTAKFRDFTHGYAVTSHASQSKTVDHVIVAAERLDAKSAYVACSRGRHTCTVHTPDKAALLDRLPSGKRAAALDMLDVHLKRANTPTPDRTGFWARAQAKARALPQLASRTWDLGSSRFKEAALRACRGNLLPGIDTRRQGRTRQHEIEPY